MLLPIPEQKLLDMSRTLPSALAVAVAVNSTGCALRRCLVGHGYSVIR